MIDNSKNRSDEKNQKNKKEISGIGGPRVGDTITLHDAAVALSAVAPAKKDEKISDGKLLLALKSGEVQAGFHASIEPLIWISIPKEYWFRISTDVFRRIRYSSGDKSRPGTYKVPLTDFPKEYMSALIIINPNQELSPDWAIQTFVAAIARIKLEFEVEISKENWGRYLQTQAAIKSPSDIKIVPDVDSGSGRKAYAGWKNLNAMLAAYLVTNNIKCDEDEKIAAVAARVYELAKNFNEKTQLPTLPTFEKEVSRVFGLIEQLQKK